VNGTFYEVLNGLMDWSEMKDYDAILGLDWLEEHYALVDCRRKRIVFRIPGEDEFSHPLPRNVAGKMVISAMKAMCMETYDGTMADRYTEGTPQPDLNPEAWVDATGGPRKGRVYSFGDNLDTIPVLSSYASSVAPPTYASSSAAQLGSGVEEMRTLIREELQAHFGMMVE
ncbi:hypothetical protein Taro_030923, partial [Colocasia esculenta]|nr:hypothetical protein [Colocasia esculenta]